MNEGNRIFMIFVLYTAKEFYTLYTISTDKIVCSTRLRSCALHG